ncbi:DNA-directed RNA polymerase subunit beta [Candidatus Dependentiae bacterium]
MSGLRFSNATPRKSFGKIEEVVSLPDLIEIQSKSFNDFVQLDMLPTERENIGLEKVFKDVFPIEHGDRASLEYAGYELGNWECVCGALEGIANRYKWQCSSCNGEGAGRIGKGGTCPSCQKKGAQYVRCQQCHSRVDIKPAVTVEACRYSGKTYSMPLKVKLQLLSWDVTSDGGEKVVRDIREQDVFFCDLPVMVDAYEDENGYIRLGSRGTFLINGVDRVVVSQIHRAPGILFNIGRKTRDFRGDPSPAARIIPARGAWLDFEFDQNDVLHVKVDKRKKLLATTLMQALGFSRDELLSEFYSSEEIKCVDGVFLREIDDSLLNQRIEPESVPKSLEKTFPAGTLITKDVLKALKSKKVKSFVVRKSSLVNRFSFGQLVDESTGEVILESGDILTSEIVDRLEALGSASFSVIQSSDYLFQPSIAVTLSGDSADTYEKAVREVYCRLRPGDIPSFKVMEDYIKNMLFSSRLYDLTEVGRIRINRKLGLSVPGDTTTLTKEDVISVVKYLVGLKERKEGELDDIDHLGNRCVRLVGELLKNQLYSGFARVEKIVKERFRLQENNSALMPYDFVNVKPLVAVLGSFFGTGQLSQFMDQTNPLSEMAHKRRLSALGPGGITRERATLDVRDVHPSHYGRICPIETPDGQNIGLISSLSTYAHVNSLGFVETTYRPVENSVVGDEVVKLDAFEEIGKCIAQATAPIDKKNRIEGPLVAARRDGNIVYVSPKEVDYIDASPRQLVSVATAMIPFLENDDANRALMGSNMQRQAVPLIMPNPPIVGTGVEKEVGSAESSAIIARNSGVVRYVSADKIIVSLSGKGKTEEEWMAHPVDVYKLKKFGRSSHCTWLHYTPIVKVGQDIERGQVLTDGAAVTDGELALGNNILVAFMPWHGYNFEDAIVVSRRLVEDDVYTSIHIEEFTVEARDTKIGAEEITADIPNISERELESLDEDGIVKVGTRVSPGDILVGKVTLKGDVQVSPEEKLLRAIFGEKSREVRDTSARVDPGISGTVVDVKVFSRSGIRKDKRYKEVAAKEGAKIEEEFAYQINVLRESLKDKIIALLEKSKGVKLPKDGLKDLSLEELVGVGESGGKALKSKLDKLNEMFNDQVRVLDALKAEQIARLRRGDELPSGVIKMVSVYVAMKRSLSVGDKMAGRHGNKGVVSTIVHKEDMPYLPDGRPVDIVLNPLGVPGRMNVGQILETMLGMACRELADGFGSKINEMSEKAVKNRLEDFFGKEVVESVEGVGGAEALQSLAKKVVKKGFYVSTPVFDGANFEDDICPLLKEAELPERGVYDLYDGQTGEKLAQPVTVGVIYMMKLDHMADDKLHARSVGPYSLITQQPLGGKAQFGGQRLGEMEVWALFAYGAAYTLQEMLTIKSDDVNGRSKAYEAIVHGDEVPTPGLPESFNVLVKELQSLGLQVDLFKANEERLHE